MNARKLATWHLRQTIVSWKAARSYTDKYTSDVEAFRAIFGLEERAKHAAFHYGAREIIMSAEEEVIALRAQVAKLQAELAEARKEVKHWKANHDHQVRSKQRGHEIQADLIDSLRDELDALRAAK